MTTRDAGFRPLWDIVEEHLDEAEFLWEMWEHGLVAPHYTLDAVAEGPEARLRAHLDALVVHGPRVAHRTLLPALDDDEPARVSAAATALLLGAQAEANADEILAAVRERPEQRPALVRALACVDLPALRRRLRGHLADLDEAVAAAAAEVLLFHHEPLGEAVSGLLASGDRLARALALRAVPHELEPGRYVRAVQAGLRDLDPVILDAAIDAGVRLGLAPAWERARERARDPDGGESMLLLAVAGTAADHASLAAALVDRKRRPAALWALGFLGTPEVVDASLDWLEDASIGHLVGEVFTAVSGVDLARAGMSLPPPDSDEEVQRSAEDELPRPDPMAVLHWWTTHRDRFADGQRHVAGLARSDATLIRALRDGPMRRRGGYLLDLSLARTRRPRVQLRAPTARQRAELAAL
jgi:uncharacterized protein (TIGR02270 family)